MGHSTADYSPSSGNPDFQQEVVPVIFITNQTILQCPAADIEKLARNCADRIDTVYRSHFNKLPNEYQFDCDWTVKTKRKLLQLPETHPETKERSPGKLHHPPSSNQVQGQNRSTSCGQGNADVLRFIGTYGLRKQNTILNNKDAASYIKRRRLLSAASGHRPAALQLGNSEKSVRTD